MWFRTTGDLNDEAAKYFPKYSRRIARRKLIKKMKASILSRIPKVKPLPIWLSTLIFGVLAFIGLSIGATIATYVFFGIATLAGLVAIAESNRYVRFLITKSNKFLDLLIFAATIYATAILGVTITASLVFAGLGYTLVYAPWLRQRELLNKLNNK